MKTAQVNGVELAYEEFGDGEPLLLVMGLGAQMVLWPDPFCRRLADLGFRVIRFDNRDVGLSSKMNHLGTPDLRRVVARFALGLPIESPYTLADMATDAASLLDHLGIERAHVAGASMGGMIAQRMALDHGHRVATLTSIMSGTGERWQFLAKPRALRAMLRPSPTTREEAIDHLLDTFRVIGSQRWAFDEELFRSMAAEVYERGMYPRGFVRQLTAICAEPSRRKALARASMPALVIHGTEDPLLPAFAGRVTARALPNADFLLIDGMGHDLPQPTWSRIARAMRDLADRVTTGAFGRSAA